LHMGPRSCTLQQISCIRRFAHKTATTKCTA
jgi:hypothetical protein